MKGNFSSPNYPYYYPSNAHCRWIITVPHGNCAWLSFTSFDTERRYDLVEVRSNETGLHKIYSGIYGRISLLVGRHTSVSFRSDRSGSRKGFLAEFRASNFCPIAPTNSSNSTWQKTTRAPLSNGTISPIRPNNGEFSLWNVNFSSPSPLCLFHYAHVFFDHQGKFPSSSCYCFLATATVFQVSQDDLKHRDIPGQCTESNGISQTARGLVSSYDRTVSVCFSIFSS